MRRPSENDETDEGDEHTICHGTWYDPDAFGAEDLLRQYADEWSFLPGDRAHRVEPTRRREWRYRLAMYERKVSAPRGSPVDRRV